MSATVGTFARSLIVLCMAGSACRPPQEPGKIPAPPQPPPMEQSADAAELPHQYVRVSRTFFEEPKRPLMGEFTVSGTPDSFTESGPVSWKRYGPDPLPASAINPNEKPIADFRDYTACVEPVGLCFKVMPDVASLGLSERDIRSDQLRAKVADAWNVAESEVKLRFLDADRGDGWVKVSFQVLEPRSAVLNIKIWQ